MSSATVILSKNLKRRNIYRFQIGLHLMEMTKSQATAQRIM